MKTITSKTPDGKREFRWVWDGKTPFQQALKREIKKRFPTPHGATGRQKE